MTTGAIARIVALRFGRLLFFVVRMDVRTVPTLTPQVNRTNTPDELRQPTPLDVDWAT